MLVEVHWRWKRIMIKILYLKFLPSNEYLVILDNWVTDHCQWQTTGRLNLRLMFPPTQTLLSLNQIPAMLKHKHWIIKAPLFYSIRPFLDKHSWKYMCTPVKSLFTKANNLWRQFRGEPLQCFDLNTHFKSIIL